MPKLGWRATIKREWIDELSRYRWVVTYPVKVNQSVTFYTREFHIFEFAAAVRWANAHVGRANS